MSLSELKEQVLKLPLDERVELAAFLAALDGRHDAEFRQQLASRMQAMDAGKKVTQAEFEAAHALLLKEQR